MYPQKHILIFCWKIYTRKMFGDQKDGDIWAAIMTTLVRGKGSERLDQTAVLAPF